MAYELDASFTGNVIENNTCDLQLHTPGLENVAPVSTPVPHWLYTTPTAAAGTTAQPPAPAAAENTEQALLIQALMAYSQPTCYGFGIVTY